MNNERMAFPCDCNRSLRISVAVSILALAVIVVGAASLIAWRVMGK